jgi:arsenate reductase (glutaredoxin)
MPVQRAPRPRGDGPVVALAPMAELIVYEKPTCTTCRKLFALLAERGIDAERVDYHVTGLTEAEIRDLLAKAGAGPRDVLRAREPAYADHVAGRDMSDDDLVALMAEHPELVQRPIVVRGDRAVLARPVERVLDLL